MDIGLLILRVVVGLTLSYHGTQKLFGWFGGPGLDKAGAGMAMLGFIPGRRAALMAGLVELLGGLLLMLGLTTPAAATLVFSVMLVAGASAHLKNGFSAAKGGYEFTMVLGLTGVSLAFTGPGVFSLDALLGLVHSGVVWGLGAVLVGAVGAGVQLALRRAPAATPAQTPASAK